MKHRFACKLLAGLVRGMLVAIAVSSSVRLDASAGLDVGVEGAERAAELLGESELGVAPGGWLRVRGLPKVNEANAVGRERAALRRLREGGWKICALIEWDEAVWTGGVRAGGGKRIAVDLREVWMRARALGKVFAGCVDAWEIGNEPDISFLEENAETYAAYLKTCRLGLLAGANAAELEKNQAAGGRVGELDSGPVRVVMAPLALPPGPYFERLWENGAGGVTEGFNFHFYGYAEDFSDVYGQFRDAVEGRRGKADGRESGLKEEAGARELPVFITEYGYGLLDGDAGRTREGRTRQLAWFQEVGAQLRKLRPETAMAFVLMPYLERGVSEFGLLMESDGADGRGAAMAEPGASGETAHPNAKKATLLNSPALTWLLAEGRARVEKSQSWCVTGAVDESPVVLDFVPGEGLEQRKSFLGYFARGETVGGKSAGRGEVIVYNFSDEPVAGVVKLGAGLSIESDGGKKSSLRLKAGERRGVRVRVDVDAAAFRAVRSETMFLLTRDDAGKTELARCVTTLWPDPTAMAEEVVSDFSHEAKSADRVAERLLQRARAVGEPALQRQGRWLASKGVVVTESAARAGWKFRVEAMPEEPARPAMVELPLPEGFVFAPGMLLEFSHRLAEGSEEREAWFEAYFRTENGNLYQVWPRSLAERAWGGYAEAAENFTMAFFGRAKLPWRFAENKPMALVFFLRPEKLPAVFEIEDAAITRRVAE